MVRTDAAERMDRMYRYQRYIYDATRRHYLLGRSTLINGLIPPDDGAVLEIGCGTGWNLVRAANTYPAATFHGFDVSTTMLVKARNSIHRSGHSGRIMIAQADATAFSGQDTFGRDSYDRIYASYTLSMIPDWVKAVECALDHLAPAGAFHIVDFGSAGDLPAFARVGLHAWLKRFDVVPRTSLRRELSRLAASRQLELFHTELYRGYAQYAVLTRR